jgi:TatD DNase family protein
MVDSHCHLADDAFVEDLTAVIDRAKDAGLTHALCILAGGNATEAERAAHVRTLWPGVRTAIGVHPHQAGEFEGREHEAAEVVRAQLAEDSAARAVGEIGLDYHYDFAPKETQRRVFRVQIQLARDIDLPVVIHTREAEDDTLAILREERPAGLRGVLHCFTGTRDMAEQVIDLGLHISFAGIVTFPKSAGLRELAQAVPEDRLLCETDSPYLAPTPYRGKRNEPAWVVRVADELATLRRVPFGELRQRMTLTFATLFRP